MGMAHRAPMDGYKRRCDVKRHAVERLRERFHEKGDLTYRDDEDIANKVDQVVTQAIGARHYESIIDRRKPTLLVDVSEALQDALYAIVREDRGKMIVVTLLTKAMVEKNRSRGRWTTDVEDADAQDLALPEPAQPSVPEHAKFKLGDQIGGQLALVKADKASKKAVKAKPEQPPAEAQGVEIVTIRFRMQGSCEMRYEDWERADVKARLGELANDPEVDPSSIAKANFAPVKVKTVVVVDDD
jgi:hypothetical protein